MAGYESDQLDAHLHDFINAYDYGRRLKKSQGSHTLRIHQQNMDTRTITIHL